MKKKVISIILLITISFSLFMITGCGENKEEQSMQQEEQNIIQQEVESPIKNGQYNKVLTEEDISLAEGDMRLEIYNNNITIIDDFAPITQNGTFEIVDNKLVGTYTTAEYLDQSTGNMAEKNISEEFEFEILEDGTLKDNKGFGQSFGKNLFKDATYKLYLEYKDISQWKEIYLDFAKKELKESDSAHEGETLVSPFIALIDLNFDNIPELLYYDAESYINAGDMDTCVYTIENGKVVYKTKIAIRRDEKFIKIDKDNKKLIVFYDDYNMPTKDNIKVIEDLTAETLNGYAGNYTINIENENGYSYKEITEEEFNNITSIYFENTNITPETLKTYEFMEDYTDEQKESIFNTAKEEYENR